MAHFAELDENNRVKRVIVVNNEVIIDEAEIESEALGIQFCETLLGGTWLQTSFNSNIRGKFAAIGDFYNSELDQFETYIEPVDESDEL